MRQNLTCNWLESVSVKPPVLMQKHPVGWKTAPAAVSVFAKKKCVFAQGETINGFASSLSWIFARHNQVVLTRLPVIYKDFGAQNSFFFFCQTCVRLCNMRPVFTKTFSPPPNTTHDINSMRVCRKRTRPLTPTPPTSHHDVACTCVASARKRYKIPPHPTQDMT